MPTPTIRNPIIPCLWFNPARAEEAARFYVSVFPNSRITRVLKFGEAGKPNNRSPDEVLMVEFELDGQKFTALNGGSQFTINPAISFQVMCDTQDQVDHFWSRLGAAGGGDPDAEMCSWLKDKFGVSWQIVPKMLIDALNDPDAAKAGRAMITMMGMKKIDIAAIEKACRG